MGKFGPYRGESKKQGSKILGGSKNFQGESDFPCGGIFSIVVGQDKQWP